MSASLPGNSTTEPSTRLRTILRYTWLVPGVTPLVVAWIFFARWQENRRFEQKAQEAVEKKRAEDRRTVESLGGSRFEILHFYASPGIIRRGETVQLCYGVSNAKKVRLEPQSNAVWPSFGRCVDAAPVKTTTYTLTIEDATGNIRTSTLTVTVR